MSFNNNYYNGLNEPISYITPENTYSEPISDNPNYFNTSKSDKTSESSGKGFFLFRRRSSTSKSNNNPVKGSAGDKHNADCNLNNSSKQKGSFRSLLRSKSGSSATMSTMLCRSSVDEVDYTTPGFSTLGRFRSKLGSFNDSSSCFTDNDDVFLDSPRDAKHKFNTTVRPSSAKLNNSSSMNNSRRHSIGSFIAKEKNPTSSVSDQVPAMPAPKPPSYNQHTIGARLKNHFKMGDSLAPSGIDDILVVTARQSEPGILWVNYLKTCFDKITKQRGRVPFNFLHLKIDDENLTVDLTQRCLATKLQIVIICPTLIGLSSVFLMSQLSKILNPEKVLGLLLDVTEAKVWEIHKTMLPSYKQWRRCIVRNQDQSFVSDLLGIATDILGRALRQQPVSTEMLPSPIHLNTVKPNTNTDNFTILPRKVKIGQNKVIVLLNEPLVKDDWIKIKIERTGHTSEITNVKRRNPYAIQFNIPDACMEVSCMINIRVEKNSHDLGIRPIKCESRLKELEQLLKFQDTPMEFMCSALGILGSDRDKLDTYLIQSFRKNIPPNFHLLASPYEQQGNEFKMLHDLSTEEYPTMLHFAARWGLEKLCIQLLECPGGDMACEIKNVSGKTPAELAGTSGYIKLCSTIKNFSQMNEFSTMYQYFKGISESDPKKVFLESKQSNQIMSTSISTCKSVDGTIEDSNNVSQAEGYLVMSGSGSGSDVTDSSCAINAVSNLNYLNVNEETEGGLIELNDIKSEKIDVGQEIMTKELQITEPVYFDSQEMNNKSDALSQECTIALDSSIDARSEYQNDAVNSFESTPEKIVKEKCVKEEKINAEFGDYLTHPSNIPVSNKTLQYRSHTLNRSPKLSLPLNNAVQMLSHSHGALISPPIQHKNKKNPFLEESSHVRMHFKKKDDENRHKGNNLKRQGSDISKKSVDDELVEIINDFKNNVFTIQEVEQLVETWKNRNDVQQGIVEKQEQLQKMREEYDRIQKEMKDKLKRPTPFERMKKLFSKSKSQSKDSSTTINIPVVEEAKYFLAVQTNHRPISSLSLHSVSSSSSGRMSTGSACSSLGDSGTHSDNETRKNLFLTCRAANAGNVMENYLIPPTPRPVTHLQNTNDEKERILLNQMMRQAAEHYVLFPSNIPYTPQSDMSHVSNSDYINYPILKTIEETKETDIPVSVQPIHIQKTELTYTSLPTYLNSNFDSPCTSSFKPDSPAVTVNTINNQAPIYTEKDTEQILNELKFNEICKSIEDLTRSPQSGCSTDTSNSTVQSPQHNVIQHDYMNVRL